MDTPRADRRGRKTIALLGGLIALVGLGSAMLQPALADDDDWHTEADRPLASPSQADTDRDDALPSVATKPAGETLYAPPGIVRSVPAMRLTLTSYQTADGAPVPADRTQGNEKR